MDKIPETLVVTFLGAIGIILAGAVFNVTQAFVARSVNQSALEKTRFEYEAKRDYADSILKCQEFDAYKDNEDWGYQNCFDAVNEARESNRDVKFL